VTGARRPLGWDQIEAYLVEVGAVLERCGLVRSIVVVGSAARSDSIQDSIQDFIQDIWRKRPLRADTGRIGEPNKPC